MGIQFYFVNRQTPLFIIMLRIAAFAPAPYHAPAPHPAKYVDEAPKPYAFQYGVADDYSGAKFNAQETADGKAVPPRPQARISRLRSYPRLRWPKTIYNLAAATQPEKFCELHPEQSSTP